MLFLLRIFCCILGFLLSWSFFLLYLSYILHPYPSAVPGILSGIILATGRIVGETAALIYTAGSVAKMATKLTDSTRTLAVHMYLLSKEGLHTDQGYATAVVLLVLVVLINFASDKIAGKVAADKAN